MSPNGTEFTAELESQQPGHAPDLHYRPDVEGLRAVAILLVVLFHYAIPHVTGGFIGVDVFFVISGFVITGLLLREHDGSNRNSFLRFYARRCRRILPAATLTIVATVVATYVLVGSRPGNVSAIDGRWVAVFLANFHFADPATDQLSALGNFWSLAVEEQFYLVYPAFFVLMVKAPFGLSARTRLAIALVPVIAASFFLSVTQSATDQHWAYLSPFTRAWELGLGAFVAVGLAWWSRLPAWLAAILSWIGVAAVIAAGVAFTSTSDYPGARAAIPVVGTALVIIGGVNAAHLGAGSLLRQYPFRWLGQRSYSLYLWHWPILIVASQLGYTGHLWTWRMPLLLGAVVVSSLTYWVVENPIRRSGLSARFSVAGGLALIGVTVAVLTLLLHAHA